MNVFPSHRSERADRRGFSLVVTVAMLSLLVVVALGMLSLSAVSLRAGGRERTTQQARSNARLALQLALGELQRLAGPDGRVTAPSSMVAGEAGQKHLTGVWDGWKWDGNGAAPDWKKQKQDRFKGWLVSGKRDGADLPLSYAASAVPDEVVRLVNEGSEAGSEVRAGLVPVAGKGGLAWAAFDASQKVDVSVSAENEDPSFARGLERFSAAHEPGFQAVVSHDWKALTERKDERTNLVTRDQLRLIGVKGQDASFHDVTSGTRGLLADPAKGGLAADLSRLFERDTLPAGFASRFLYSDTDVPLVQPPKRFAGANPLPSPDPSWALLHSHYRTYKKLSGGSEPKIVADVASIAARPDPKTAPTGEPLLRSAAFNQQQIAPVIAKAQFVFSLAFGVNMNTLNTMWGNGSARSVPASLRDTYITWLVIDPVITLWNPYNVPIEFTGVTVELHRIPMAFRLSKNGKLLSDNFTRLTDAHTQGDFQSRENRFYLLKLLPEKGASRMVMQPGEHVVFTGHQWSLHGSHTYNLKGLEMRPGFNPPAGSDSGDELGGVTTQNLFVSATGASTGKDYGKTIRTVAVKAGDQIQVEVRPEHANADKLTEVGGKEVTGFLKYYLGVKKTLDSERKLIGGIELDYGAKEKEVLPAFGVNELPAIVVNGAIPKAAPNNPNAVDADDLGAAAALRWKEPFLIATFQQKTERDSKFPSRSWLNNSPTNLYSSSGIDEQEDFAHQQYEFTWEPMTDWPPDSPTIEISNENNRGYGGSGIYAQTGMEMATFSSLPIEPAHSLGQLSHAPLNAGGQLPLTTRVVANSYNPPLLAPGRVRQTSGNRTYLDHSYLANNALFDQWFFSTLADHPAVAGGAARSGHALLDGFFRKNEPLPNSRFRPYLGGKEPAEVIARIEDEDQGYRRVAEHLMVEAPFNVNSTRVAAWEALLASNFGAAAPRVDGKLDEGNGLPVLRNLPVVAGSDDSTGNGDVAKWNGYRRLDKDQIHKLAENLVAEVKARGPFQSLAEFVNRRPGGEGHTAESGAVETAIERAGINDGVLDPQHNLGGSGNTADGAPGVISQADLLTPLLPQLTARGDTFTVRAYGEASGGDGATARAWCEATVQRFPEYLEAADEPSAAATTPVNLAFGRQFRVVSFRWLTPEEL